MEIRTSDYDKSDVNRLLKAFNHQEPDRIPHIELWVTSQAVYEYVLERELDYVIGDAAEGGQSITPEDDVEFARRPGQDAVLCNFNWRPNNVFERPPMARGTMWMARSRRWPTWTTWNLPRR